MTDFRLTYTTVRSFHYLLLLNLKLFKMRRVTSSLVNVFTCKDFTAKSAWILIRVLIRKSFNSGTWSETTTCNVNKKISIGSLISIDLFKVASTAFIETAAQNHIQLIFSFSLSYSLSIHMQRLRFNFTPCLDFDFVLDLPLSLQTCFNISFVFFTVGFHLRSIALAILGAFFTPFFSYFGSRKFSIAFLPFFADYFASSASFFALNASASIKAICNHTILGSPALSLWVAMPLPCNFSSKFFTSGWSPWAPMIWYGA